MVSSRPGRWTLAPGPLTVVVADIESAPGGARHNPLGPPNIDDRRLCVDKDPGDGGVARQTLDHSCRYGHRELELGSGCARHTQESLQRRGDLEMCALASPLRHRAGVESYQRKLHQRVSHATVAVPIVAGA